MATVGTKYQVVIDRRARETLGVVPGWKAVQCVVNGHLEMRFLPPEHNRSLAGSLSEFGRTSPLEPAEQEEHAWAAHVDQRWGRQGRSEEDQ